MDRIRSTADMQALSHAARAYAVIASWQEAGAFQALHEEPMSVPKLAETLELNERAVRITSHLLRHIGLIVGPVEQLSLSVAARDFLAKGELPGKGGLNTLREHSQMFDVLKQGGPVLDADGTPRCTDIGVKQDSPEQTRGFLTYLYGMAEESSARVFQWLSPRLSEGARVLDLGGGHGRYARRFADAGFDATLFDLPVVMPYASELHGEHLTYIEGDFREANGFGGPYDLILVSNILHGEPPETNRELVRRLSTELAPGGLLVLKDMYIDEQGRDSQQAIFFGVTMLFYTRAGESPSIVETKEWIAENGLVYQGVILLETSEILIAQKPG